MTAVLRWCGEAVWWALMAVLATGACWTGCGLLLWGFDEYRLSVMWSVPLGVVGLLWALAWIRLAIVPFGRLGRLFGIDW